MQLDNVIWNNTFYGQSPGDLDNKKNGFAGRFSGYNEKIKSPLQYTLAAKTHSLKVEWLIP